MAVASTAYQVSAAPANIDPAAQTNLQKFFDTIVSGGAPVDGLKPFHDGVVENVGGSSSHDELLYVVGELMAGFAHAAAEGYPNVSGYFSKLAAELSLVRASLASAGR
jgi:hypothetical protein